MSLVDSFIAQARARSAENAAAFAALYQLGHQGVCIGLLRQELDTLLRASYLWHWDTSVEEVQRLLKLSAAGRPWTLASSKGVQRRLTDRAMLDLASHLGGWEQVVYSFGCSLIHLSSAHLYRVADPLAPLTAEDRQKISAYIEAYHLVPVTELSFATIVSVLPAVMDKLTSNVQFYLEELAARYG